ncbi:hypothetical protein N7495_009126 [Penicillium taxi]|uniref:uncharacterized protein n=1 Tax=Penicillium taxi TaxID=168475 RepID=UPI002545A68F|nr:uncharacterized protein N7495_009126 [Penicillium taxi]KAJ5889085.1 hypothetical protein N7495_009126 [Penicillium taxi]
MKHSTPTGDTIGMTETVSESAPIVKNAIADGIQRRNVISAINQIIYHGNTPKANRNKLERDIDNHSSGMVALATSRDDSNNIWCNAKEKMAKEKKIQSHLKPLSLNLKPRMMLILEILERLMKKKRTS